MKKEDFLKGGLPLPMKIICGKREMESSLLFPAALIRWDSFFF